MKCFAQNLHQIWIPAWTEPARRSMWQIFPESTEKNVSAKNWSYTSVNRKLNRQMWRCYLRLFIGKNINLGNKFNVYLLSIWLVYQSQIDSIQSHQLSSQKDGSKINSTESIKWSPDFFIAFLMRKFLIAAPEIFKSYFRDFFKQ